MSKSDPSDLSRINLIDDADTIAKKIRKAKTDPDDLPSDKDGLEGRPEARNLLNIYAALGDTSFDDALAHFGGKQFRALKEELTELTVEKLTPITDETRRLMDDWVEIDRILQDGADRASAIAEPIMKEVRQIVGFV